MVLEVFNIRVGVMHTSNTNAFWCINIAVLPLAPFISSLDFVQTTEEELNVTWSQETTDRRPVDTFLVIVKSCSTESCEIILDTLQLNEEQITIGSSDAYELIWNVDEEIAAYTVVVCAINILGKNCSSPEGILLPQKPTEDKQLPQTTTESEVFGELVFVTTEESPMNSKFIALVIFLVLLFLLCCVILFILLIVCCWYLNRERSYFPSKNYIKF